MLFEMSKLHDNTLHWSFAVLWRKTWRYNGSLISGLATLRRTSWWLMGHRFWSPVTREKVTHIQVLSNQTISHVILIIIWSLVWRSWLIVCKYKFCQIFDSISDAKKMISFITELYILWSCFTSVLIYKQGIRQEKIGRFRQLTNCLKNLSNLSIPWFKPALDKLPKIFRKCVNSLIWQIPANIYITLFRVRYT